MTSALLRSVWAGLAAALLALAWGAGPAAADAVPVRAAMATLRDVPVTLRNIGTVQATDTVVLRARVDGTIDRLFFTEGQDVTAGQVLAQIDPRPYEATLAAAQAKQAADQATLANAQHDLARYSSLARSDFASRQQVDTQRATVAQLQASIAGDAAQVTAAQLNLVYARITSPISGRTGLRLVDPGNLVQASAGTGIVSVTQIHPIQVVFTLPQEDLPQIQDGMRAGTLPVLAYAGDDRTLLDSGTLLTIDNQIDQSTGTIKLKATFPNPHDRLWPGQFVNVRMQVATLRHVLTVPSSAVLNGPGGQYVYLVKPDGTVAQQTVQTGLEADGVTVIPGGLTTGARVVTAGQERLQAGTKVEVAAAQGAG